MIILFVFFVKALRCFLLLRRILIEGKTRYILQRTAHLLPLRPNFLAVQLEGTRTNLDILNNNVPAQLGSRNGD